MNIMDASSTEEQKSLSNPQCIEENNVLKKQGGKNWKKSYTASCNRCVQGVYGICYTKITTVQQNLAKLLEVNDTMEQVKNSVLSLNNRISKEKKKLRTLQLSTMRNNQKGGRETKPS